MEYCKEVGWKVAAMQELGRDPPFGCVTSWGDGTESKPRPREQGLRALAPD